MESSLCIYKGKIQEAFNLVQFGMNTEYRLKAIQYWNTVSENLQNLVNPSSNVFSAMNFDGNIIEHSNNSTESQNSPLNSNQPQVASSQSDLEVYNIVFSSNNSRPTSSDNLYFDEYLTNADASTDCINEIMTSSNDQPSGSENSNIINQGETIISNKSDDDNMMRIVEQTIEENPTIEDPSNNGKTTISTFANSSPANVPTLSQTSPDIQSILASATDRNISGSMTQTSSSLTDAYMIDSSSILSSSVTIASDKNLIGSSNNMTITGPSNDIQQIEQQTSNPISLSTDDINPLTSNTMMNTIGSRTTYLSNVNSQIVSGVLDTSIDIQAQPSLIPPAINNNNLMQSVTNVILSHASPVQTYHHSALHHQLRPLNGYDHHIAVQNNRPLQHQLINYEMVGLNPEYNYIRTFSCDTCGKQLDSSEELSMHTSLHTPEGVLVDGDSNSSSQARVALGSVIIDNRASNTSDTLNQHCCDICGKSGFSTKGNLKRHLRAHSGEKPFKCEYCDSRFTEKKSLKIHLRRHTGEKPYKCDICGKLFSQTGVLQSHMALHLNERKFGCNLCGKAFRQRSQLKLHIMRHEGVKRLECSTCSAKFLTKGDLERHYRIHTGERPYECKICKKTFTRQQSLNEHLNRHYGTKPYSCPSCEKTFSEMSACYKHAKIHKKQDSVNNFISKETV